MVKEKSEHAPRPSEHPPVMGSKVSFRYRSSDVDVVLGNCTKLFVTKDQHPPTSNSHSGHKKRFRWDQGL